MDKDKTTDRNATLTREHLANERTFLAWQRTAIATMGFGVVIARLNHAPGAHDPGLRAALNEWHVGVLFVLAGILSAVLSATRYFKAQKSIEAGGYAPNNTTIAVSALINALMGLFVLIFLIVISL
jgi:putative membrane protein